MGVRLLIIFFRPIYYIRKISITIKSINVKLLLFNFNFDNYRFFNYSKSITHLRHLVCRKLSGLFKESKVLSTSVIVIMLVNEILIREAFFCDSWLRQEARLMETLVASKIIAMAMSFLCLLKYAFIKRWEMFHSISWHDGKPNTLANRKCVYNTIYL